MSRARPRRVAIQLVVVGKIRSPLAAASEEYERRISERRAIRVDEVPHGQGGAREAMRKEADRIRSVLLDRAHAVCLDPAGRDFGTSEQFADWMVTRLEVPVPTAFVIGGPDGLDDGLVHECAERRSLGRLTFPHQLARVLMLEQIYRAVLAGEGHPYPR